jgi:ABC-type nitrate/sulfonate/bicarbonate transport system ATPase subunit
LEETGMIKFTNVTKCLGGRTILKDVSFEINQHETVAVLGASGSGKTTLLKLIAGVLQPDSGSVEVDSRKIGFVFQDHRLLPWRTAQDNIILPLLAAGKSYESARRRARSWMDHLRLHGFYNYYPRQMSGGMVQRVSLARAFAIEPDIMLMDEPLSSLDARLADSLRRELKEVLTGYRMTTVYVTHDYPEALSMARRIFRLQPNGISDTSVSDQETALKDYFNDRLNDIGVGYW